MPAFVEGMMQPPPAKKAKKGPLPKDFVYRKKQPNATSAGTSLQSGKIDCLKNREMNKIYT